MAKRPVITRQMAEDAAVELARQYAPGYQPTREDDRRKNAADVILRHYATQERYALDVQSPADFAKAVRNSPNTRAAELDRLTPEALAELQQQMVADYPGKPS
jgi:hypothetical protein